MDAAVDDVTQTSSEAGPQKQDTGSTESSRDVALDGTDDTPDGESPDRANDAADGPMTDVANDGNDESPDGMPDGAAADVGVPSDAGPRGDPNRPPVLHVFATTNNGGLWLVSAPLGSLTGVTGHDAPIDVSLRAGSLGVLDDVEAQSIGDEVNVFARKDSSVFATSVVDQAWQPWVKVANDVTAMGLANVGGKLWACLASNAGHLRLMLRQGDGWHDLGDVMDEASIPANMGEAPVALSKLDCVGAENDLEIFALDRRGELWHATKTATRWIPFQRMTVASGLGMRDIDAANAAGEIHLIGSTPSTQYHGVFSASGAWASGFNDVEQFHNDPQGELLAGAAASILTELELVQVNSLGQIWISSRYRDALFDYVTYVDRAPDDSLFMTGSATAVLPY